VGEVEEGRRARGRTRRASEDRLRAPLSVLLTEAQRAALYVEAKEAGFDSVSEYIRRRKLGLDDAGTAGVD